MAGKRASMREGPLAALFRKTETEGLEDAPGTAVREESHAPRKRTAEKTEEPDAPRVPSPQERLRHAFSSELDLPDNFMDMPEPATEAARAVIDFTFEEYEIEHLISSARVVNPGRVTHEAGEAP